MAKRDYYEVLGVNRNASQADLKKAYRRTAMKHHPDRNPGDKQAEAKFKEASEAFEVLSDEQKRARYNQFGHAGVEGQTSAGAGAADFADIFGDIFGDIFSARHGARGNGRRQGADLQYHLELSLEEAVQGVSRNIRVPSRARCATCGGSGARKGSGPVECSACGGIGQVRMQQGFFSVQQTCPRCRGEGKQIKDPCSSCRGSGTVEESRTLSVKVPAGVDTGDRIRLTGEGQVGDRGGPPGDLYVRIEVRPHPVFQRDGADLHCDIPINFVDAALGNDLEVPTLSGRVKLKIPAETQTGKLFRLRGKGITPVRGGSPGDLLYRLVVETPVRLTPRQRELLEEFGRIQEEQGNRQSPKRKSWRDGVKRFVDGLRG